MLAWGQAVAPERQRVGRVQLQTQETISCKWSAKTAWKPTCPTDPDAGDTAQGGTALVCTQRAPRRRSTCKLEPAGHVPLPTEQEAMVLGKQGPGTDRGAAPGPWWGRK